MDYSSFIRNVPDFPKPGIQFKDITTLIKNGAAFRGVVKDMLRLVEDRQIDLIAGIESRGFLFAAAMAYEKSLGVIPIRKPGKLPAPTLSAKYALEYGQNELHIHTDAIKMGQNILIVDDLLATGGTAKAACELVEKLGGRVIGVVVVIELTFLPARKVLQNYDVFSLVPYSAE